MGRGAHEDADDILRRSGFGGGDRDDDEMPEFEVKVVREETYYIRAHSAERALRAALDQNQEPDNEHLETTVIEVEYADESEGEVPTRFRRRGRGRRSIALGEEEA